MMTATEYAGAIRSLNEQIHTERRPGTTAKEIDDRYTDREFLLAIDYLLGEDFPQERREQLLHVHRVMRGEVLSANRLLLRCATTPEQHSEEVRRALGRMDRAFAGLLNPEEYRALMGSRGMLGT